MRKYPSEEALDYVKKAFDYSVEHFGLKERCNTDFTVLGKDRDYNGIFYMDLTGDKKRDATVDDILAKFNAISIECGN